MGLHGPLFTGRYVSSVVSREAGHSPWLTFLAGCNFPGAMKTLNLENPYGAKRYATAIIPMFHFPDNEFHEILTKTICGQAVYFVVRRIIVLRPLSQFITMLATHNMPNLNIIRRAYRLQC